MAPFLCARVCVLLACFYGVTVSSCARGFLCVRSPARDFCAVLALAATWVSVCACARVLKDGPAGRVWCCASVFVCVFGGRRVLGMLGEGEGG